MRRGTSETTNRATAAGLLTGMRRAALGLVTWCMACLATEAGDWPQILGPQRNGTATGEQLDVWPTAGPPLVWERAVGEGFAGAAIAGPHVIVFHRPGRELVAECLNLADGQSRWTLSLPTNYRGSISPDSGPRCVPLIHGGSVYLLGPAGELAAVELSSGKLRWTRNVMREFNAPEGYFGTGSSPIVAGDKLLLNVGGRGGAGIVAFSLTDGSTVWKSTDAGASYSSPVSYSLSGKPQVVFVTRLSVISLDPESGQASFEFPFGQRGPTVNAANPLVLGDHLFVSASYGIGAQWVRLAGAAAQPVWERDDLMSSQYTTCVADNGILYGIDGRQDVGVARLRAIDPAREKMLWSEENFGTGSLILAGNKLLIMKTDGTLVLAAADPNRYRPLAQAQLFETTVQALPALSQGLLVARDTTTLKCVSVGKAAAR